MADPHPSAWSTLGSILRLIASIAAPVVLVGVTMLWFVRVDVVANAVSDRATTASDVLEVALQDELRVPGGQGLEAPGPSAIDQRLATLVAPVLGEGLQVRIVGLDGVVAYSTTRSEIGEPTGMVGIAPSSLRGVPSGRRIAGPGEAVVYSVPVAIDGSTRAAARVTVPNDPVVARAVERANGLVAPMVAAMTALLIAITPLAWWSLGEVRRQYRKTRVLAMSDPLTGLANRTQFHHRLDEAIAAADRSADHVGLVLLDLDGFKAINDRGGHAAGDRLLKRVAGALGEATRRNEIACRLGGDEFAVIAPRVSSHEELVALAERLHEQIDLDVNFIDGRKLRVTASLGLAMFPDDARAADDLLNVADVAMYRVKAGRRAQLPAEARQRAQADTR